MKQSVDNAEEPHNFDESEGTEAAGGIEPCRGGGDDVGCGERIAGPELPPNETGAVEVPGARRRRLGSPPAWLSLESAVAGAAEAGRTGIVSRAICRLRIDAGGGMPGQGGRHHSPCDDPAAMAVAGGSIGATTEAATAPSPPTAPARRSLANTMRAIRRCIPVPDAIPDAGADLLTLLRNAVMDRYDRKKPKRARYRPPHPDKKPLGAPKVRRITDQEKKCLRKAMKELAA